MGPYDGMRMALYLCDLLPKTQSPSLIMRKTSDKFHGGASYNIPEKSQDNKKKKKKKEKEEEEKERKTSPSPRRAYLQFSKEPEFTTLSSYFIKILLGWSHDL